MLTSTPAQSYAEPWIRFIGSLLSQFNALTFVRLFGQFGEFKKRCR